MACGGWCCVFRGDADSALSRVRARGLVGVTSVLRCHQFACVMRSIALGSRASARIVESSPFGVEEASTYRSVQYILKRFDTMRNRLRIHFISWTCFVHVGETSYLSTPSAYPSGAHGLVPQRGGSRARGRDAALRARAPAASGARGPRASCTLGGIMTIYRSQR